MTKRTKDQKVHLSKKKCREGLASGPTSGQLPEIVLKDPRKPPPSHKILFYLLPQVWNPKSGNKDSLHNERGEGKFLRERLHQHNSDTP
jgi:hypothetical protein